MKTLFFIILLSTTFLYAANSQSTNHDPQTGNSLEIATQQEDLNAADSEDDEERNNPDPKA